MLWFSTIPVVSWHWHTACLPRQADEPLPLLLVEAGLYCAEAVGAVIEVHEQACSGMVKFAAGIASGMCSIKPLNAFVAMGTGRVRGQSSFGGKAPVALVTLPCLLYLL